MFTFKKYNRNATLSTGLADPVTTNIDTGTLVFFNSGVPTPVLENTAATNELYILSEKLVNAATEPNKEGRKLTAVYFPIKDSDLITGTYVHPTATTDDAPAVGAKVPVNLGKTVIKTGEGLVDRFQIVEVRDAYTSGDNTYTTVTLKKI